MIDFFFAPISKGWFIIWTVAGIFSALGSLTTFMAFYKDPDKGALIACYIQTFFGVVTLTKIICFLAAGRF